jgi:hypothetical protein
MPPLFDPAVLALAAEQRNNPANAFYAPPADAGPEPKALEQLQSAGINMGPVQGAASPDYVKPAIGNAGGGRVPADYDPATMGPILGIGEKPQRAAPMEKDSPKALGIDAKPVAAPTAKPAARRGEEPGGLSPLKEWEGASQEAFGQKLDTVRGQMGALEDQQRLYQAGVNDKAKIQKQLDAEMQKQELDNESFKQHAEQRSAAIHDKALSDAAAHRAMSEDPQKWYKDRGVAGGILAAIAVGAGAFAAAMPHGSGKNYAQEIIDKSIQRDIDSQRANIEKAGRVAADSVAAEDRDFARTGAEQHQRNLLKTQTISNAMAQMDVVASQTSDQTRISQIGAMKEQLAGQLADLRKGMADSMVSTIKRDAAAAGAASGARDKWIRDAALKLDESGRAQVTELAQKLNISPEEALHRHLAAIYDGSRGNAGLLTVSAPGKAGEDKLKESQTASTEFNRQMDDIVKSPVLDKIGLGTAAFAHLGQRLAPESSKTETQLDTINTQMLQAVGKVAKDADGKPNIAMIERLEERFSVKPGDTKEQALTKIQGARDAVNALARQQGANAPVPTAGK